MTSPIFHLGIDGGGSTTRALITDGTSHPLCYGESGPSNPNTVGYTLAANNIAEAYANALSFSNRKVKLAAAHFGIAGVGTDEIAASLRKELSKFPWFPDSRSEITHDLTCALEGGLGGRPGIVLVAGTGSAAYGVNSEGETARASGRSLGNNDPGSGYAIGCDVAKRTQPKSVKPPADRSQTALLAEAAINAATKGEAWACRILKEHASCLTQLLQDVAQRIHQTDEAMEVILQGGLIDKEGIYRDLLMESIGVSLPTATVSTNQGRSIHGACILARALVDGDFDRGHALQQLVKSKMQNALPVSSERASSK